MAELELRSLGPIWLVIDLGPVFALVVHECAHARRVF